MLEQEPEPGGSANDTGKGSQYLLCCRSPACQAGTHDSLDDRKEITGDQTYCLRLNSRS